MEKVLESRSQELMLETSQYGMAPKLDPLCQLSPARGEDRRTYSHDDSSCEQYFASIFSERGQRCVEADCADCGRYSWRKTLQSHIDDPIRVDI